ncbi:MAG: hypothetical protein BMS9Abin31_0145 [Gammaproteobacteria bacterium]|nr:MAG: hypothetical protein BMS9Abin31_0145 [Gammaproteobacteria bacterium]
MKTVTVNNKRKNITYKTNSGMYTQYSRSGFKTAQYGADVYTVDDSDDLVIVATSHNGSTLKFTAKVITEKDYDRIAAYFDVYNEYAYHNELMTELNFH